MKLIVDTNIIISSLITQNSRFRDIIFSDEYEIYSCNFIIVEIFKNKEKLIKYTKLSESSLLDELYSILKNIHFISSALISDENISLAYELCKYIDEKDTLFLALTFELNGLLWTGDKKLKIGLEKKGINSFFEY